jgi:hypothetical protein
VGGIGWRGGGGKVYFLSQTPQCMMAADVGGLAQLGTPRPLFAIPPGIGFPAQLSDTARPNGSARPRAPS